VLPPSVDEVHPHQPSLSVPDNLFAESWVKSNVRDGQVRIARGADVVVLEAGKSETVKLGDISIAIGLVHAGKKVRGALDIGKKGWSFTGLFGVLHAAILGGAAMFMPPLAGASTDGIGVDQQAMLQQYLAKAAEKEQKELEGEQAEVKEDKAAQGGRAPGAEGAAGNPVAKPSNGRMAIKGDKNNTDIHVSKADAVHDAANFGFIGVLSSMEGSMGPKSPFGDFASGNDPVNAMGHLWGDNPGDAPGSGLGLTGTGENGGGKDGIIGVGDKIGGLGTCFGENCGGAGFSRGRLTRGHKPSGIKVRPQGITSVGVLPAEVIQRVVRQNFGRFRLCYENGLRNNPNLAGRVAVRFVIGRDGAASGAGNGGSDMPDAGVVSCVVRSFNGLSFPAPEAGIVTVTYPIAFSSN